jgi:EpsI family protein
VAVCAIWPAFVKFNDRATHNPNPVQLATPAVNWAPSSAFTSWTPSYMKSDASYRGDFRQADGKAVALTMLYYRNQNRDKALISSVNRMAGEKEVFHEDGSVLRTEQIGGRTLVLREARMQSPGGNFLVWHWNWIDGEPVTNAYLGKLRQARIKLLFGGDDGAAVLVAAPYSEHQDDARATLRAFLGEHLAAIDAALATTRSR